MGDERPALVGAGLLVENAGGERQPAGKGDVVLVVELVAVELAAGGAGEAVLVRVVDLALLVVVQDEVVVPPAGELPVHVGGEELALGEEVVLRAREGDVAGVAGVGVGIEGDEAETGGGATKVGQGEVAEGEAEVGEGGGVAVFVVGPIVIRVQSADAEGVIEDDGRGG